ncbi:hypothetical protein [Streptomyces ortus]|uniref:Uncharacterized protein n=1 Tax=Streptomyces ortus TaxID=2867268 RepID=A0ABT3V0B1_9ACTN|nr:hypothetical protein [Streptomyces ortus]MCX4232065.1 hypothetical protein [Streptomyces ortus]
MKQRYDDSQEAGRAWMRGELSSEEYFAMARRQAVRGRRLPALWWRIRQALRRSGRRVR